MQWRQYWYISKQGSGSFLDNLFCGNRRSRLAEDFVKLAFDVGYGEIVVFGADFSLSF